MGLEIDILALSEGIQGSGPRPQRSYGAIRLLTARFGSERDRDVGYRHPGVGNKAATGFRRGQFVCGRHDESRGEVAVGRAIRHFGAVVDRDPAGCSSTRRVPQSRDADVPRDAVAGPDVAGSRLIYDHCRYRPGGRCGAGDRRKTRSHPSHTAGAQCDDV